MSVFLKASKRSAFFLKKRLLLWSMKKETTETPKVFVDLLHKKLPELQEPPFAVDIKPLAVLSQLCV